MSRLLTKEELQEFKQEMESKDGKLRLSANWEAVILLRETFESGAIDPGHTPARLRNSESHFQRYSLSKCRSCFNKLKKEYYPGKSAISVLSIKGTITCLKTNHIIFPTFSSTEMDDEK